MTKLGETIRKLREDKGQELEPIAAFVGADVTILKEIEQGQLIATREQVLKIAAFFKVKENDLLRCWLSDKVIHEVADEELGLEALQMAEDALSYTSFKKIDRKKLVGDLLIGLKSFPSIEKAWLYGSFSREDDSPKSDIDIAIKAESAFSYFDLAEVQFQLEKKVKRKVDVGFIDSFKPYIFEHVKPDLKLIYERSE
ncbi:MAG: nucleotidyltransferase domain-containing protein [Ferruginibacter sp.]